MQLCEHSGHGLVTVDYNIQSDNCGDCPLSTTDTNVLCNLPERYLPMDNSIVCTFSVKPRICGHVQSENSYHQRVTITGKSYATVSS